MRRSREGVFPLLLMIKGLHITIEKATATKDIDRKRILNTIVRREVDELEDEPFTEHKIYDEVIQIGRGSELVPKY